MTQPSLYLEPPRRPAISVFGFVFIVLRCSRIAHTFRSGARESLAKMPNLPGGRARVSGHGDPA